MTDEAGPRHQDPGDRDPGDRDPGGRAGEEAVGPLAEEAARLFTALGDWARDHAPTGDPAAAVDQASAWARAMGDHLHDAGTSSGTTTSTTSSNTASSGAAECQWCPLCRAVHTVRHLSPEVRDHLATAVTSLGQAAATLLATSDPAGRPDPSAGVEHIDLDAPDPGSPDPGRDA